MIDCKESVIECMRRILNVRGSMRSILKAPALAIVLLAFASLTPLYAQTNCDTSQNTTATSANNHRKPGDFVSFQVVLANNNSNDEGNPLKSQTSSLDLFPSCTVTAPCVPDLGVGGVAQPISYQSSSVALGTDCTTSDDFVTITQDTSDPTHIVLTFANGDGTSGELQLDPTESCTITYNLDVDNSPGTDDTTTDAGPLSIRHQATAAAVDH